MISSPKHCMVLLTKITSHIACVGGQGRLPSSGCLEEKRSTRLKCYVNTEINLTSFHSSGFRRRPHCSLSYPAAGVAGRGAGHMPPSTQEWPPLLVTGHGDPEGHCGQRGRPEHPVGIVSRASLLTARLPSYPRRLPPSLRKDGTNQAEL